MIASNPQIQELAQTLNSVSNPKDYFYQQAREKGMNDAQIDEFLKTLRNRN